MKNTYSPTYVAILDLLFKTKTTKMPVYQVSQEGGTFDRAATGSESDRLNQDFYVAASELWSKCNPHEWHLVGRIASELKKYNALWKCDPALKKNGTLKKSIQALVELKVLIKTETTHIYFVNPIYIRRGDFSTVLNTTAKLLMDTSKVNEDHLGNNSPVKHFEANLDRFLIESPGASSTSEPETNPGHE